MLNITPIPSSLYDRSTTIRDDGRNFRRRPDFVQLHQHHTVDVAGLRCRSEIFVWPTPYLSDYFNFSIKYCSKTSTTRSYVVHWCSTSDQFISEDLPQWTSANLNYSSLMRGNANICSQLTWVTQQHQNLMPEWIPTQRYFLKKPP